MTPMRAERRRQLHRAAELNAFRLNPAGGEMTPRDGRIFGRDADVTPARRIVVRRHLGRLGDGQPAAPDAEVERCVDLGIVELHQHVLAGDTV